MFSKEIIDNVFILLVDELETDPVDPLENEPREPDDLEEAEPVSVVVDSSTIPYSVVVSSNEPVSVVSVFDLVVLSGFSHAYKSNDTLIGAFSFIFLPGTILISTVSILGKYSTNCSVFFDFNFVSFELIILNLVLFLMGLPLNSLIGYSCLSILQQNFLCCFVFQL